jgi:hypothetical protein
VRVGVALALLLAGPLAAPAHADWIELGRKNADGTDPPLP